MRTRRSADVLFGSAGWLFADLMLALVVMLFVLATISTPEESSSPRPKTTRTTTATTTTTPPVTTTTTTRPPALLRDPIKLDVFVDTEGLLRGDGVVINAMRGDVSNALAGPLAGRRVGFVLTFGSSSGSAIQRGITVAGRFNDQVLRTLGVQFADAVYRSYFQGGGNLSKITLEIFVFDS
jgi:hypothetical protein